MPESDDQPDDKADRGLLRCGVALFFLGLVSGLVVPVLINPRMGLSAHLEGVLNGTFLVAMGLIWGHLRLAPRTRSVTRTVLLYGAYANWATTEISAVFGTSGMTPIAGAGHSGSPWQETLVGVLLYTLTAAMLGSTAVVLWGLRGRPNPS